MRAKALLTELQIASCRKEGCSLLSEYLDEATSKAHGLVVFIKQAHLPLKIPFFYSCVHTNSLHHQGKSWTGNHVLLLSGCSNLWFSPTSAALVSCSQIFSFFTLLASDHGSLQSHKFLGFESISRLFEGENKKQKQTISRV
jgi:hypothetical protein